MADERFRIGVISRYGRPRIILGALVHSLYYYGRPAPEFLLHNSDTSSAVCIPILDMCFHMYLCTRFCVFVMFVE